MKAFDIVKLMKAGYTPGEIAKLEDPASVLELIAGGVEKDQVDECLSLISQGADPEPDDPEPDDPEPDDPEPDDPKPDYEKMYNELLKKIQKEAMQKDISGSNPPPKSTDEILKELAVDYM